MHTQSWTSRNHSCYRMCGSFQTQFIHSLTQIHTHAHLVPSEQRTISHPGLHILWIGCYTAVHSLLKSNGSATGPYDIFITVLGLQLTLAAHHRPVGWSVTQGTRFCFIVTRLCVAGCTFFLFWHITSTGAQMLFSNITGKLPCRHYESKLVSSTWLSSGCEKLCSFLKEGKINQISCWRYILNFYN